MNKITSTLIARTITNEQLLLMINNAKDSIKDWKEVSNVNQALSKGVAWNILCYEFDVNYEYPSIIKVNMIREFGEYLPDELKIPKKTNSKNKNLIYHEEPKFK